MSNELTALKQAIRKVMKHHKLTDHGDGVIEADLADAMLKAAPTKQSYRWKELVDDAISVLQRTLPKGALPDDEALSQLYGIFYGTKYREIRDTNPVQTMVLNGHQLEQALELIAPLSHAGARDEDELEGELTFGIVRHKDDNGVEALGMCCWNSDTDGVMPLDECPVKPPAVVGGAEVGRIMSEDEAQEAIQKVLGVSPIKDNGKSLDRMAAALKACGATGEGNQWVMPPGVLRGFYLYASGEKPLPGEVKEGQGALSIGHIVRNAILANSHPISTDPIDGYLMFQTEAEVKEVSSTVERSISSQWVTTAYTEQLEQAVMMLTRALNEERRASSTHSRMSADALLKLVEPIAHSLRLDHSNELRQQYRKAVEEMGKPTGDQA